MNDAALPSKDILDPENPAQLTDWENEPSLLQLKQDYDDAKTEADNQVLKIQTWLDNLHIKGSAKRKSLKHKSNIQPKLIRKQAEWRYSSLSEPFLSTDDVFNVSPAGHRDTDGARQNQLVLNHQFNNEIDKVEFIDEYVRTAVDEGTVTVRVGWEYEESDVEVEVPIYDQRLNPSPEFTAQLQQLGQLLQANPEQFRQEVPVELQRSLQFSMQAQQPIEVFQSGTEFETQTRVIKNNPTVEVCDYRDVVIDPSSKGKINKAKFAVYKFVTNLEELRSSSIDYKNLERIIPSGSSILGDPDHNMEDNETFNFNDEPRKKFLAYEYWGYWDIDGSGTVKPIVATWVGKTLIRLEENPFPDQMIPFVTVPYLPVRKSLYGEPDGELTKDNQDVVGAVTRGMLDILASNANGQRGTAKHALDLTNKRRFEEGKDYEFNPNTDPRQAFHTNAFAEIPVSAQFMLQTQNQEAESLTGVKAFNSGISGQALGEVAAGVRGALDASSKREVGILRRLASGMVKIGHKIISMNSEFLEDEKIIRITDDEFVAIERDALAGKFNLKLSISTAEEDNQKAQELAFMLQTTGPSSDPAEVRMIRAEIARLRKMPDLAKRIEDYEPQPDPLAVERQQLENELLKAQIAETLAESQQRAATAQLNQAKAGEAESQTDLNNLDFIEQESGVKQERDLQLQGEQAKGNVQRDIINKALDAQQPQQNATTS